jgi:hypothetical protein
MCAKSRTSDQELQFRPEKSARTFKGLYGIASGTLQPGETHTREMRAIGFGAASAEVRARHLFTVSRRGRAWTRSSEMWVALAVCLAARFLLGNRRRLPERLLSPERCSCSVASALRHVHTSTWRAMLLLGGLPLRIGSAPCWRCGLIRSTEPFTESPGATGDLCLETSQA